MKVFVKGGKPSEVNLLDKDFLAEGGEGKIYGNGNTVYKIYSDPKKMISPSKIDELSKIDLPNILGPKNIILDAKQVPIGFTMPWAKDTIALCKLFTNDFRNRFGITDVQTVALVERIATDTQLIHKTGFLIVDGNEMNYLVDTKSYTVPFFIDVDSWQTPLFPATALMASVKDHHSSKFTEFSDWFSFAVIATQLFVGIHPYKGTHPDFKKSDMEGRMRANVSIFNPDVKLPGAVRAIDTIPANYKEWLMRVLEKGERIIPPDVAGAIIAMASRIIPIVASNQFVLELIKEYSSEVLKYVNGYITIKDRIIGPDKREYISARSGVEIVQSPVSNEPIKVYIDNDVLMMEKINPTPSALKHQIVKADDKMVFNNSVFIKHDDKLMEIDLDEFGTNIISSVRSTWNILPNATKLFNGLIYQNVLGVPYFMLFYKTAAGKTACAQFPVKELQGYQVLEAKYENCVASVVAAKNGKFDTFMFKFQPDFKSYSCVLEEDTGLHVPNFIVMDNGICIRITADDDVQIFSNRIDRPDVKLITDPAVTFDMKLTRNASTIMVKQGSKLYKFSMKK